jgi:hypothetical protein
MSAPDANVQVATTQQQTEKLPELPTNKVLQQAMKLSIKLQKPIDFYFYVESLRSNVCFYKVDKTNDKGDKIIYKNEDEYSSPILNTYKSEYCYLVVTENTLYVLHNNTKMG